MTTTRNRIDRPSNDATKIEKSDANELRTMMKMLIANATEIARAMNGNETGIGLGRSANVAADLREKDFVLPVKDSDPMVPGQMVQDQMAHDRTDQDHHSATGKHPSGTASREIDRVRDDHFHRSLDKTKICGAKWNSCGAKSPNCASCCSVNEVSKDRLDVRAEMLVPIVPSLLVAIVRAERVVHPEMVHHEASVVRGMRVF
jgi:hypothetical protein